MTPRSPAACARRTRSGSAAKSRRRWGFPRRLNLKHQRESRPTKIDGKHLAFCSVERMIGPIHILSRDYCMRKSIVLLALTALLAACANSQTPNRKSEIADPGKRPNIVLIVADDLGYADIGAQQLSRDVKTPNIDSIATNGVRFTS